MLSTSTLKFNSESARYLICDKPLTAYRATASLRNNTIFTVYSRTASELFNSLTARVKVTDDDTVLQNAIVFRIHFVTLSRVVYVTVVKRGVTDARKRHTIHTTHLGNKTRVKY